MNKHLIYLLVRNDPFAFGELTGMLRRQSRADFDLVALVAGIPDGKLKMLLDGRVPDQLGVDEKTLAQVVTDDIARRAPTSVTLLDTTFMPSNTAWFERVIDSLERGDAKVVLSRMVHDLYTNWLVQNDLVHLHHRAEKGSSLAFLYPFSAVTFTPDVLAQWPLVGGDFDHLLLRWGFTEPGPALLVHDALVTHVHPLTPGQYVAAHVRFVRLARPAGGRLGYAIGEFIGGVKRDISFAFSRRRPQWIFYSIYLRLRIAFGIVRSTLA